MSLPNGDPARRDGAEPSEGYLDDDFARFRAARLNAPKPEPEPKVLPEPEPETFFGTDRFRRSQIRDAVRSEANDPERIDEVIQRRRPTARRAPPPPLPPLRSRPPTAKRAAQPSDTDSRPTRRRPLTRTARVRRADPQRDNRRAS